MGSTNVFVSAVGDLRLTFEPEEDGLFRDRETESLWTLSGHAIGGPLNGEELKTVAHGNHFWFAWVAFRPETEVWDGG